ncbi:hypothetical protein [Zavarzinella formosa]|uniref:hypothetical protein n=1 Tax=Zavarzinella formosa TaxID=360055 RepID=UPI00031516C6|nr:hypothetical protein [Zavarzinella formosa]
MTRSNLTKLTPFLTNHFCEDYVEDVRVEFAHNNYHCSLNILLNSGQYPKANFDYREKVVEEIPLFWPELTFSNAALPSLTAA